MRRAARSPREFSRTDLYVGVRCRETSVGLWRQQCYGCGSTVFAPSRVRLYPKRPWLSGVRVTVGVVCSAITHCWGRRGGSGQCGRRGAAAVGAGGVPAGVVAGVCPVWLERTEALSDVCRLLLPACLRWEPLRRQLRIPLPCFKHGAIRVKSYELRVE